VIAVLVEPRRITKLRNSGQTITTNELFAKEDGMKTRLLVFLFAGILMADFAPVVMAHHSFAAEFDGNKEAVVKGVLTKVIWSNPHVYIYMDVTPSGGQTEEWKFETAPPSMLHRMGVGKDDFKIGDMVTMTYCPAKSSDARQLGWMKMIKYSDGHVYVYRDGSE
jgi:hypothetical protein